ncbi:MAG: hypothetical protein HYS13_01350 [Planctomycetia bacterium]|nr:hypothetical protein [Planctomycetia bacterium]
MSGWFPCCCPADPGSAGSTREVGSSSAPPQGSGSSSPLGAECNSCPPQTTHRFYSIEISGMADAGSCTDCGEVLNATFVVEQCIDIPPGDPRFTACAGGEDACLWSIYFDPALCPCPPPPPPAPPVPCGGSAVEWIRMGIDTDDVVRIYLQAANQTWVIFEQALTPGQSCAFLQFEVPFVSADAGFGCDASGAVCKVTAVT